MRHARAGGHPAPGVAVAESKNSDSRSRGNDSHFRGNDGLRKLIAVKYVAVIANCST
jgi:hypothetical protein